MRSLVWRVIVGGGEDGMVGLNEFMMGIYGKVKSVEDGNYFEYGIVEIG